MTTSNGKETPHRERLSLPLFFVLLFCLWIGFIPMILASYGKPIPEPVKFLQIIMLLGPALVACFASYINGGWPAVKKLLGALLRWRVHFAWYILAIAGPPLIYGVSLLVSNAMGATSASLPTASQALSVFAVSFGIHLLLNTEEIAWRGYALPRLQSRVGIVWATVVIGVLWAVIHLPLFWLKGGHPAGYNFWLFAIRLLCMNILFTATYFGTSHSLLIVHFLHQALNAGIEAVPAYPRAVHSEVPITIATVVMLAIGIFLFLHVIRRYPELLSGERAPDMPSAQRL